MSDLSQGAGAADATGAAGAPPVGTPAATAPPADPFDDGKVQTFDRAYVEKLRNEAAGHRTRATEAEKARDRYQQAFGSWDQDDADVLLDVIAQAATDPKAGAAALTEIARILAGDVVETPTTPSGPPKGTALTQEDLDQILSKRDADAALRSEVANIEKEAVGLGYEKGSADYFKLLWLAKEKTNFDLGAAHKVMQDEQAAIVAKYLAAKKAEAEADAGAGPEGGAAPSNSQPITNLRQASASARARLAAAHSRA